MEFEKLQEIIAEVLNVDEGRHHYWTPHLWMILVRIPWIFSRLSWESRKNLISRSHNDDAEKIVTVQDAVEPDQKCIRLRRSRMQKRRACMRLFRFHERSGS